MNNFNSKMSELDGLKKSKKLLESKISRIKQSLEFTKYCDKFKKFKAIEKTENKLDSVNKRIDKLLLEI